MIPTLSIITATSGRETLTQTLASLAPQLEDGDELLVVRRDGVPWGNATRDEAISRAAGSHLWWMDDDDVAAEGALATIRRSVAEDPGTVHIFRMEFVRESRTLWNEPKLSLAYFGGPQCVVPNILGKLGSWVHAGYPGMGPGACGDFHFVSGTLEKLGREPRWHEDVIALIKPWNTET